MRVDGELFFALDDRGSAARSAAAAAEVGYDRLFVAEAKVDPFLPPALAAGAADIDLGTSIAVAFARNPMTTAMSAHNLATLTGGRFVLGLGSQVAAHITRRYSMPWSRPAARMRDFVLAMRAIWDSWQNGTRLRYEGEFYQHTLSSFAFDPGPSPHPAPPVYLGAIGPRMTEVAGEVADGLLCHGLTSVSYFSTVMAPALRRGLATAGRDPGDVDIAPWVCVATAPPGGDLDKAVEKVRLQLAFYGSTPAYARVLDHHGWGDLQPELHRLSKQGRWAEMGGLLDDEVLNTFAVIADADHLAGEIRRRWGGLAGSVRLNVPYLEDPDIWAAVIAELKR